MKKNKEIEQVDLGWKEAVVMVCTKCGKQFSDVDGITAPERIKSELKSLCKDKMGKDVRVINTGCLNICPENKIAVAIASNKNHDVFKAVAVPPDVNADDLFKELF